MQKIISETGLRKAIIQLEDQQAEEGIMLRKQFNQTIDSLKPINLIKSTLKEAVLAPDIKGSILNTSVGLTAGFISKLLLQSVLKSPLNRLIGTAVMFGITNVVAKHPDAVKSLGKRFFNVIRGKPVNRIKDAGFYRSQESRLLK
jgi:hypothetical protein